MQKICNLVLRRKIAAPFLEIYKHKLSIFKSKDARKKSLLSRTKKKKENKKLKIKAICYVEKAMKK